MSNLNSAEANQSMTCVDAVISNYSLADQKVMSSKPRIIQDSVRECCRKTPVGCIVCIVTLQWQRDLSSPL